MNIQVMLKSRYVKYKYKTVYTEIKFKKRNNTIILLEYA